MRFIPTSPLAAATNPVVRVLPLLGLPHLDRPFDFLIKEEHDREAQPGVKVRVRFAGRLVDAILLERAADTDFEGDLKFIDRVISPEVVYPPRIATVVEHVAQRYGATRSDVIRAAIPARHAGAERADTTTKWEELGEAQEPDLSAWALYQHGRSFVDAVVAHAQEAKVIPPRAAWQMTPGEDWARTIAALAVKVVLDGAGALIIVPDQRDVDALEEACRELVAAKQITILTAAEGPQARYRRYLSVLHGQGRLVIGTRSAAFAPVNNLRFIALLDDGNDALVDPRAPYHHAREVLTTRSSVESAALVLAGFSRTAEVQLMVDSGWLHDLLAPRQVLRDRSPHIRAAADSEFELARDPRAATARIPKVAFDAARRALDRDKPVLVQVPRKGYVPTLACGNCRHPARCRACNGPMGLPDGAEAAVPTCRWCGRPDSHYRCGECGSPRVRAVVLGAGRTAEELGRAFANTKVIASGGARVVDKLKPGASVVVATPGAEPRLLAGGYGAALLLDTWAMIGRQDLRASEEALNRWAQVAAMVEPASQGGEVIIMADPAMLIVQALIRWDMVAASTRELDERREVGFPPTVHMAAIDGTWAGIEKLLALTDLPEGSEILGPVELPAGVSAPAGFDEGKWGTAQRVLIRSPLRGRNALGKALKSAQVARAGYKDDSPVRVQIDPVRVG